MKKDPIEKTLNIDLDHLNAYSAGLLQGKAYRALNAHLNKALYPYDLSIPEWKLIGQLFEHGSMKLAELAERLTVEPPLITNLIDQLEKKELVERIQDKKDRRAKIINPTKKAENVIPEIDIKIKQSMNELLAGVSREDLKSYIKVLQTIVNNA
jgi:MarR family transcriptional regulator for hemolysin